MSSLISKWPCVQQHGAAVIALGRVDATYPELLPSERLLTEGTNRARTREISAGRSLARLAMEALGQEPGEVLAAENGSPKWPDELCGSISHSSQFAVAAIAPRANFESIGIDIDDGRSLENSLGDVVTENELSALQVRWPTAARDVLARIAFSAKEAIYKCQAPVTGNTGLGFLDIELALDCSGQLVAMPTTTAAQLVERRMRTIMLQIQGVNLFLALLPRIPVAK